MKDKRLHVPHILYALHVPCSAKPNDALEATSNGLKSSLSWSLEVDWLPVTGEASGCEAETSPVHLYVRPEDSDKIFPIQ